MIKIKCIIFLVALSTFQMGLSQSVTISGRVESNVGVENVNVINISSHTYALTNANGEFTIKAKLNDTLQFLSILHKTQDKVINEFVFLSKILNVVLEEKVNELPEVTVGKALSGDLLTDIKNVEGERPINFFDVGIPGYTGKKATQSERRLWQANGEGTSYKVLIPQILSGSVPLDPIMNGISGRTKMLRKRVATEEKEELMQSIKGRLSRDFFASNPLDDHFRMDFFYFCADDKNFIKYCKNQTDFKILVFLRMKYSQYMENINESKD